MSGLRGKVGAKPVPFSEVLSWLLARAVRAESGCLEWTGCLSVYKVPIFRLACFENKPLSAPRAIYRLLHPVSIPRTTRIFQSCKNRLCIEPTHLIAVPLKAPKGDAK